MYIYHFKNKEMIGDTLIPLNQLKKTHPNVYDIHVQKYKGREELLEKQVPPLNCLWNDVLHFSPINPQLILDVYKEEDLLTRKSENSIDVYKVPISKIREEVSACFQSYNFDFDNYSQEKNRFWHFIKNDYVELKQVPIEQIEIWHADKKAGRPLFWYSHIMHILIRDSISVEDCELISCY